MARIKNGVLGGFSGKAGSVVGYEARGKSFIRGLPKISNKKPSVKQLANRAKFKLIQSWRSKLTDFFAITFKNHSNERSAQNAAHHFNSSVITGEYPNFEFDPAAVVISAGSLPGLLDLMMTKNNENLHLTWTPNVVKKAKNGDLVALLISYDQNESFQWDLSLANRRDGKADFELAILPHNVVAHVYMTVISNDRQQASDSIYLGALPL